MKCPACSTVMSSGTTKVASSTLDQLFGIADAFLGVTKETHFGSQQYLYFYSADGGESECVFEGTRNAFRCPKCQTVVIAGQGVA